MTQSTNICKSTAKTFTTLQDTVAGDAATTIILSRVTNTNAAQARTSQNSTLINVYSFALKPEEHQPSGTYDFSRIDSARFEFQAIPHAAAASSNPLMSIYAVNYNVLRIMSGMGGLAYSIKFFFTIILLKIFIYIY